uniref:Strictosidine synthase-like protein n=1 Tax=Phelipanche aegyptiaca TaxID=99112 RepID=A0A023IUZ0_9LAMI|nr:strictosidine synthase-like protein [Phelipanche aegyptiaca]
MPIGRKVLKWPVVAAIMAVLVVFFGPYIIGPESIEGSTNVLTTARTIPLPVDGPESMDWDPQGEGPYVGVTDGRILKWSGEHLGWVEFAYSSPHRENCSSHKVEPACGRPLGLSFEKKTGDLYFCDGYLGVMKVGPKGGLAEKVVDEVEGQKVMFANQMDIDEEEDVIYFNDSSDTYHFADVFYVFLRGEKTGRAIRYDKKTKEAKVVMDRLHFPNGLVLSKDNSFVLSCEAPTQLVHRYWIKGPKAGTRDIFAKLPGYADNIRRTETGDFWVALHSKKTPFSKLCMSHPLIGQFFIKTLKMELLVFLFSGGKPHAVAVKLCGKTGEVLEILEDSEGKNMKFVSEVQERDGKLWFGSVFMPSVWVLDRQ